jgi:multidrug efflux pump
MAEITGPIVAITLVLSSVFVPSAFIPGLTGQFYRQFALTIAVAMVISAVNAMTLTPSRAVTIFKTEQGGHGHAAREALPWWIFAVAGGWAAVWFANRYLADRFGWPGGRAAADVPKWLAWAFTIAYFTPGALVGGAVGWVIIRPVNAGLGAIFRAFNRFFDRVTEAYGWVAGKALRLSALVLVLYGGLLFLTGWGLAHSPTGFIPMQDQGYLLVNVQLPDSASVQRTQEVMDKVAGIAAKVKGVTNTLSIAGQSFLLNTNGSNLGSMFVILDDFANRRSHDRYDAVIAAQIQRQCFAEVDDAQVGVFRSPPIRGLGNAGGFKLQTEQRGFVDLNDLQSATDELVRRANADPHFAGVLTLFRANTPQLYLDIDRVKCEALQVPLADVFATLQVYMGGLYVNNFNKFGRTWQVQVMADAPFRHDVSEVKQLKVRNRAGQMVPLGTLAPAEDVGGPMMVMRYNMYTSAPVNGNPAPGVSSGQFIPAMQQLADDVGVPFEWTEVTFLQIQAGNLALLAFALGTVMVYLVLAAKYESWGLPLAVILVVPLCVLSAVAGMAIVRLPVDLFVQIGLLVLVGLASKNAILIVEFAKQLQDEGRGLREAVLEASRLRLRPIVMTSFAFIFGILPLVFVEGAGAEMRRALGTAVFAGMIGVTAFGLFFTPVFYAVIRRFAPGKKAGPAPTAADRRDGASTVAKAVYG